MKGKRSRQEDYVGKQFGMLTVKSIFFNTGSKGGAIAECVCSCGNVKTVRLGNIVSGNNKSCGCLRPKNCSIINKKHWKSHGLSRTPEYSTYCGMLARCKPGGSYSVKNPHLRVDVCDRWMGPSGVINFINDVGRKPSPEMSLDRIDPYGNYEPSNVRWATAKTQATNQRRKRLDQFSDEKLVEEMNRRGFSVVKGDGPNA